MSEPRYYVASITGYAGGFHRPSTSYSVLDSAQCHAEVFTQYVARVSPRLRLLACEREAARLNALDAAGCLA